MKRTKIQNETVFMLEDEIFQGSVFPNNIRELKRDVKLFNNVDLQGSIYGNSIEFHSGDIYVRDAVFAMKGINITGEKEEGKVWINSPVAAKESILSDGVKNNKVRVTNNVSSEKINLKNSIIYGNVYGKDIILEDTIVLGGVYCKNKLELNNSIVGTFDAKHLVQNGAFGLINNFARISNKPEINFDIYSISLVSFNGQSQNTIFKISIDEVFPFFEDEGERKSYIISTTLRIFDIANFEQKLVENNQKLVYLTMLDKTGDHKEYEPKFKDIEFPLFDIISKRFCVEMQLPESDFINLPNELVSSYIPNTSDTSLTENSERLVEAELNEKEDAALHIEKTKETDDKEDLVNTNSVESNVKSEYESESENENIESNIESQRFCTNCGDKIIDSEIKFCTSCGNKLS